MGEEMLPQRLQRWERVHSRILSWVGMEEATIEDVGYLAAIYARGVALGPDVKQAILRASRGSLRNVSTNLAALREFAAVRGLTSMTMSDWGNQPFHTGEAPQPRSAPVPRAVAAQAQRRGAA